MDELALVSRASPEASSELQHYVAPIAIAEQNFGRKKLLTLEQNLSKLQSIVREQQVVASQLECGMKVTISETDLQNAIGLAFQQFEALLCEAFKDSGTKCLAMFSKRDELVEVQRVLGTKVSWTEYNTLLKKLAELKQYIDVMAESTFVGHVNALRREFAKKADATMVEEELKKKANLVELNEVQAKLRKLENLVVSNDAKHTTRTQETRNSLEDLLNTTSKKQLALISENQSAIGSLQQQHKATTERLSGAQVEIDTLGKKTERLREAQDALLAREQKVIMVSIKALEDQLAQLEISTNQLQQNAQALAGDMKEFKSDSRTAFDELFTQGKGFKENIEFMMEAIEMIKRRSREQSKNNGSKFKELSDATEKLTLQLAALERQLKRQEREVRVIENRASKGELLPKPSPAPEPPDPNDHLKNVLGQLELIAAGTAHMQLENPDRPALPWPSDMKRGNDFTALPRFSHQLSHAHSFPRRVRELR